MDLRHEYSKFSSHWAHQTSKANKWAGLRREKQYYLKGWGQCQIKPRCYLQQWILYKNPPHGEFYPSYLNAFFILILTSSFWTSHKLWINFPDSLYSCGKVKNHFFPVGRIGPKFAFCLVSTNLPTTVFFFSDHTSKTQTRTFDLEVETGVKNWIPE